MDDEIRAAFQTLADSAPHPARVRHALDRAAQTRRQRRALLIAGGVAAGTAVVSGGAITWRALTAPDATPVGPPTPAPTMNGNLRIPMHYRPGYLPEGLREVERSSYLPGAVGQSRVFSSRPIGGSGFPYVGVHLVSSSPWNELEQSELVDINGVEGRIWSGSTLARVIWPLADGNHLYVDAGRSGNNASTALTVARSVEPDRGSLLEVPLHVRWFPGAGPLTQHYKASPQISPNPLNVDREHLGATFSLHERWPGTEPVGETVTVRGQTGVRTRDGSWAQMIFMPLSDGRYLSAMFSDSRGTEYSSWNDADALRVIEEMHIGPTPANEWYVDR